jgi:hypothetical protein
MTPSLMSVAKGKFTWGFAHDQASEEIDEKI